MYNYLLKVNVYPQFSTKNGDQNFYFEAILRFQNVSNFIKSNISSVMQVE